MPENFANRYQTTLAAAVTSGALTGTVTTATGAPAVPFRAIISAEGANTDEIVLVTGRTGTTLTWTRAAEAIAGVQAASAHVSGATITAIVTAEGLALVGPGWFNVKAEGAVGDGVTDDTAAVAAAIAKLTAAGGGTLYFPAGTYLTTGGFTIAVPCSVRGEGSLGGYDYGAGKRATDYGSQVICTSATAVLFTMTGKVGLFTDIGLTNTHATPTAGAGISVTSADLNQRVNFDNIYVEGFYDDIDIQTGVGWSMRGCMVNSPVRYAVRVRNIVNEDGGDWVISDCGFFAGKHTSSAAIRLESGGGGKIANCKINTFSATKQFLHGIDITFGAGIATGDFLISHCSIENVDGNGINIATAATARIYKTIITGTQISLLGTNTTGYPVSIVGSTTGVWEVENVVITGCHFDSNGAVPSINLVNIARVRISNCISVGSNTALYAATACYSVLADIDTAALLATAVAFDGCSVYASAAQAIPTGTDEPLSFNVNNFDKSSYHSTTVNPTRFTFPRSGYYHVWANVGWAGNTTGYRQLTIRLDGTSSRARDLRSAAANYLRQSVQLTDYFVVGHYVEILGTQSSGGSLNTEALAVPAAGVTYLGA